MPKSFLFRVIITYEILAFVVWNIIARTEGNYEGWLLDNIHDIVYITLATTLMLVGFVLVIQYSLKSFGIQKKIQSVKDPRVPDK